jgi:prepilin-type N-terminal cleavage/methylation domain-containing protein
MNKKGFTLLEMIIAVTVILIGLIPIMSLMYNSSFGVRLSLSRLQAAYLAQEGLEIVRNIRDSNWIKQNKGLNISWDDNLRVGEQQQPSQASYSDQTLSSYQGINLKLNNDGFYNYNSGTDTKFKRKITISESNDDTLQVSVEVSWQEKGKNYSLTVYENLYNWFNK